MSIANYLYDLPSDLQQKIRMLCIGMEIQERIAGRIENIGENTEFTEILFSIYGIEDTCDFDLSYQISDLRNSYIKTIYTTKNMDKYWDVMLHMNCDWNIYVRSSCYLNFLQYNTLLKLCIENGIYKKSDFVWPASTGVMIKQLLKL
jgi:hypothetical protein